MSFLTGTNQELIYANTASGTARNTFTAEGLLNDVAGMGAQAVLPKGYFAAGRTGQAVRIVARGILSTTGAPTFTWTVRMGASGTSAPIVLGTAAITSGTGVSNQLWELEGDFILRTNAAAGANSTVQGLAILASGGLASPFSYPAWGGAASPGTVATVDTSIDNYISVNAACGTSSLSNTIQLLQLFVFGLN